MPELFTQNIFLVKVLISFFTGGIFISLLTLLAEKNKKIGGLIISIPSTLPIGLFFIGWTQDKTAVVEALKVVPISLSILLIFATIFIILSPLFIKSGKSFFYKNLFFLNFISILIWSILSYLVIFKNLISITLSIVIFTITFFLSYKLLNRKNSNEKNIAKSKKLNKFREMIIRSIFSGTIIMISVILAKIFSPIWGGVFAMFPGAYLSSFNILLISNRNNEVLKRVGRTIPVGVVLFMIFAFITMFFLKEFNTVVSLLLAEFTIVLIIILISKINTLKN